MAWTEFYIQTTGDDMNAGSTTADAASVTSTNGDWGNAAANRFTAASGTPFSGVSVGDWASIYVDATTSGAVYIAQVTAVNGGGASIDLSSTVKVGTAPATSATGRSCKVGGAWASFAAPAALGASTPGFPMSINKKAGTYSPGSTSRTIALVGSTTAPIRIRGYKTTIGDQHTNRSATAGTDIPLSEFTTGQLAMSGAHTILESVAVTSQCVTSGGAINWTGANPRLVGVRCENTAANANSRALTLSSAATTGSIVACWLKATASASVVSISGANCYIKGNYIKGGLVGIVAATGAIQDCIFDGQASDAITLNNSSCYVDGCSFYAAAGNGINVTGISTANIVVSNCHFENINQASKAGINNTSGTDTALIRAIANSFYNCTANILHVAENLATFDNGTLGGSGFTNAGTGDFSASTYLKAIGYPGKFENVVITGYVDNGAAQRVEPSSGGLGIPVGGGIVA